MFCFQNIKFVQTHFLFVCGSELESVCQRYAHCCWAEGDFSRLFQRMVLCLGGALLLWSTTTRSRDPPSPTQIDLAHNRTSPKFTKRVWAHAGQSPKSSVWHWESSSMVTQSSLVWFGTWRGPLPNIKVGERVHASYLEHQKKFKNKCYSPRRENVNSQCTDGRNVTRLNQGTVMHNSSEKRLRRDKWRAPRRRPRRLQKNGTQ